MPRYALRTLLDQWRQWTPTILVIAVMSTMIGLCAHEFCWTGDEHFQQAVTAAGVPVDEFAASAVTIYVIVALVTWVSLTMVGRSSVEATRPTHARWLLLGARPSSVFGSALALLFVAAVCGALLGTLVSTLMSPWAIPFLSSLIAPRAELPRFAVTAGAPLTTVAVTISTTLIGGLLPALHASRTPPRVALRQEAEAGRGRGGRALRVGGGLCLTLVSAGLVLAAGSATKLGTTGPGPMFNLAVDAGGSALAAVYLLCPQIVSAVFTMVHSVLERTGMVVPALGVRSAADRVTQSSATIAPLAAGLDGIGLLLCSVDSVSSYVTAVQPGTPTDLTDVWIVTTVVAVSMLATSAAVVALSARGREHETALLQAAGMQPGQVCALIASETAAMSLAATVAAVVPVFASGAVCGLVTRAVTGESIVVWPVGMLAVGALASWLALFVIVLAPALAPLREGPAAVLREAEA